MNKVSWREHAVCVSPLEHATAYLNTKWQLPPALQALAKAALVFVPLQRTASSQTRNVAIELEKKS